MGNGFILMQKNHLRRISAFLTSDFLFPVIIFFALLRMCCFGFRYFPQLDDYIQYGCYPNMPDAYMNIGLYATRPLAGIFDIYVWGRLWDNMWLAFLTITVLHAVSAYLFIVAAGNSGMRLGLMFAVVYLLCPVNIEGAYWISASSRIVVPLFFASISFYCLSINKLIPFSIFQLLSLLFYEQAIVFSVVVSLIIAIKQKKRLVGIVTLSNSTFILLYYLIFSQTGSFAGRAAVTIFNPAAAYDIISSWNPAWVLKNFYDGLVMGGWLYTLAVTVLCCVFMIAGREEEEALCRYKISLQFLFGLSLFFFSYIPIFILENYVFALRNNFIPLIGIAVMVDALFSLNKFKHVFVALFAMIFIISTMPELDFYRRNYEHDTQIIAHVSGNISRDKPNSIIDARLRYVTTNNDFAEHILSISSSDWALTGAVRESLQEYTLRQFVFDEASDEFNLIYLD